MIFKKIGQGLAKGAAKMANKVDEVADSVANIAYDIAEGAADARKATQNAYRSTRNQSPKVQRQIEEGVRDASGRKRTPVKEARNSGGDNEAANEAVTAGISKGEAKSRWSWNDADGNHYYRKTKTETYKDKNGKQKRRRTGVEYYKDTANGRVQIDGEEYGKARKEWIDSLPDEVAENISKTETAETAGINLGEFMSNHPVMSAAGLAGGGFLLSELLDDD